MAAIREAESFRAIHPDLVKQYLGQIDYHFGLDLIVHSPKQLTERLALGDFFLREIIERGQVLYERSAARVD